MSTSARLLTDKHRLVSLEVNLTEPLRSQFNQIQKDFCGIVHDLPDGTALDTTTYTGNPTVYVAGDVGKIICLLMFSARQQQVKIIREFAFNHETIKESGLPFSFVTAGEVPLNIHNVGLYFRSVFHDDKDYFRELLAAHQFQELTESNKPGVSYRKGIYLTEVEEGQDQIGRRFRLLRCSTNLNGPTDAFKDIDRDIIRKANEVTRPFFEHPPVFNHVLAQVYENHVEQTETVPKDRKARIKRHSDKTKDMPPNALIAFATFYSDFPEGVHPSADDPYDRVYKNGSVLTQLRFRLKDCVTDRPDLPKLFNVTLYPNSLFVISLETNRIYTHEIVPPTLPVAKIPTRLGYVIRCSDTEARHLDGITYLRENGGEEVPLKAPTVEDIKAIKEMYFQENCTDRVIRYEPTDYSLNDGDYREPTL